MVTFDTLRASHRLRDAGFAEKQADALVNAFAEDIGANLATKDDVARVEGDIATLRQEMTNGFAALRQAIEALDSKVDSNNAALRHEMALRDERAEERMKAMEARMEERMNAKMDRLAVRFMVVAVGLAGLVLAAIGLTAAL